jgi:uncharacterized coiled-coil protein SlyX
MTNSYQEPAGNLEHRLGQVESLLTFLQRTVDDLNSVILEQQRRLESQALELARLRGTMANLADTIGDTPRTAADEKPPHY